MLFVFLLYINYLYGGYSFFYNFNNFMNFRLVGMGFFNVRMFRLGSGIFVGMGL